MTASDSDRGSASALRGWLSEVYFPSLVDPSIPVAPAASPVASLATRLGAKATVDDPLQGRATGQAAIAQLLASTAAWLHARAATYEGGGFVTGTDRDVTVGSLRLTRAGAAAIVPVAVVAERRRSREVELRVYFPTDPASGDARRRSESLLPPTTDLVLAVPVASFLDALAAGDVDAAVATFEHDGSLVDAAGTSHAQGAGGLRGFLERFVARRAGDGRTIQRAGAVDDGRRCAVEIAVTAPGLMLFERGDSGILTALRLYGDLDA